MVLDNKSVPHDFAATMPAAALGYRALLEALGVAVYITDAAGLITDYNEAAVDLWGRRPEIGKDEWCGSWRLYWPDGTPMEHAECPMAITLKENRPVRGAEAIAERPDGTRVCFVPYPTPFRDAAGTLIGAVNVLVDITERKRAEEALTENQERLAEALRAKDEFLGLVSHELRTPITMITGNAEMLARRNGSMEVAARQAAVGDIYHEAIRLNRIVADLLTLARLEKDQLETEPLVVTRVIKRVVHDYGRTSNRAISIDAPDEDVIALGEENLVGQVLRNFLSNAEKYSPNDTPIEVAVSRGEHEAVIRVLDRGMGVKPEEIERLFEPFYRSDTAVRARGLGIGLSVCQRLVTAIGGRVWAEPRPGGGSEFAFALLLCEDDVY